mgnify:CR=1 FL=1
MAVTRVTGLRQLSQQINQRASALDLSRAEFRASMDGFRRELIRINEYARLHGLDKNDTPHEPVTYRPKDAKSIDVKRSNSPKRPKYSKRNSYGNLSPEEYRQLDGPPLVPRRRGSRLISNYYVNIDTRGDRFVVAAGWRNILDRKGRPFFPGLGPNQPQRLVAALSPMALKLLREETLRVIQMNFATVLR